MKKSELPQGFTVTRDDGLVSHRWVARYDGVRFATGARGYCIQQAHERAASIARLQKSQSV